MPKEKDERDALLAEAKQLESDLTAVQKRKHYVQDRLAWLQHVSSAPAAPVEPVWEE